MEKYWYLRAVKQADKETSVAQTSVQPVWLGNDRLAVAHPACIWLLPRDGHQHVCLLAFSFLLTCSLANHVVKEQTSPLFVKLFLLLITLCSFFLVKPMVACTSLKHFWCYWGTNQACLGQTDLMQWNAVSVKIRTFRDYFMLATGLRNNSSLSHVWFIY